MSFTVKDYRDWLAYLKNQFYTLEGLLLSVLLFLLLIVTPLHKLFENDFNYETILYALILSCIGIIWIAQFKYPKNKPDKICILVSIYTTKIEEFHMKEMFIRELERSINTLNSSKIFHVISLNNYYARNIKSIEDIEKLHKKIDANIYYYGDVQSEIDGETEKFFLSLDGRVSHRLIPLKLSQEIGFDFRKLLPKEINFKTMFALRGCKATAEMIVLTTKYIAGIASVLYGKIDLAIELHSSLLKEIERYSHLDNEIKLSGGISNLDMLYLKNIKYKLRKIVSNEYLAISEFNRLRNELIEAQNFIKLSLQMDPENYSALLKKSVYDFIIDSNPVAALETIKLAEKHSRKSNEWRYSKAFLLFWVGKYENAWSECKKILKQNYQGEEVTVEEVRVFNLDLLKKFSNKSQLYFWLGFTQYNKAHRNELARDYFTSYLNETNDKTHFLKEKAKTYLSQISS